MEIALDLDLKGHVQRPFKYRRSRPQGFKLIFRLINCVQTNTCATEDCKVVTYSHQDNEGFCSSFSCAVHFINTLLWLKYFAFLHSRYRSVYGFLPSPDLRGLWEATTSISIYLIIITRSRPDIRQEKLVRTLHRTLFFVAIYFIYLFANVSFFRR